MGHGLKYIFLLFLIIFANRGIAQCDEIYLTGKVVDSSAYQSYYNLMVVNQTTKQGVFGRPNGSFSVYVRPGDKIGFSVKGYENKFIEIPQSNKCSIDTVIYIDYRLQQYEEVVIHPIKSLEQIKEEREALSQRETRTVTGVSAFSSPITFLYERFSKRARSIAKVAEMEHQDNINGIVKNLLRTYVSYDVVYLDEEEFVAFIDFLNIDEHFLKTASDYELILYIQGKLEHYKLFHPEIFNKN